MFNLLDVIVPEPAKPTGFNYTSLIVIIAAAVLVLTCIILILVRRSKKSVK